MPILTSRTHSRRTRVPSHGIPRLLRLAALGSSLLLGACSTPGPGDFKGALQLDETVADALTQPKSEPGPVKPISHVEPAPLATPPAKPLRSEPVPAPSDAIPSAYSLADVIQTVLQNHPALYLRRQEVEAARGRLVTAGLLPNPQLVLDTRTDLEEQYTTMNTRLMFTIPLGPKRRWRTAAACSAVVAQEMALSREVRQLLLEAADAALEVHYLQEQTALEQRRAELEQRLVAIQKDLFQAASTPYRSVVLAALSTGRAELIRRETAARLAQAQVRLARAMGYKEALAPTVQGTLDVELVPPAPLQVVLDRAVEVAPELAQSQALLCQSQQQLAFEQWQALPDLSIGPRTLYSLDGSPNHNVGARFALDLPLFDRNQGRIAESAALVEGNCARAAAAEITTLNDVRAAYVGLCQAQSRWEYYGATLRPQMEQAERVLREAFADRAVPAHELTALLEAFARMQLTELDLRYQHARLRTRLELLLECRLQDLSGSVLPGPQAPAPAATTAPPKPDPN